MRITTSCYIDSTFILHKTLGVSPLMGIALFVQKPGKVIYACSMDYRYIGGVSRFMERAISLAG
ncbi:MAG: hypothetical protein HBSIN02_24450 [Bacteroidia bacterium]|nr:MAG: hypothetical protein HBSIN02_24450 [Bacteroidia bacterium]